MGPDADRGRPSPYGGVAYEEYHPFGTTSWHAEKSGIEVSKKRYRYTGMERDEETGLCYHGARYLAPWLGRWCSADPIGIGDGVNRYAYVHNGPTGGRDPTGRADWGVFAEAWPTDGSEIQTAPEHGRRARATLEQEGAEIGAFNAWRQRHGVATVCRPGDSYELGARQVEAIRSFRVAYAQERWEGRASGRVEGVYLTDVFRASPGVQAQGALLGAYAPDRLLSALSSHEAQVLGEAVFFVPAVKGAGPLTQRAWGLAKNNRLEFVRPPPGVQFNYSGIPPIRIASQGGGQVLFRGTTEGFAGSPSLQRIGVTPTSTDPVVATLFGIESSNSGKGVLLMAPRSSVPTMPGNVLAKLEAEVGVSLTPSQFASQAQSIPISRAREALSSMGIDLPSRIADKAALDAALRNSPRLSPEQIRQFNALVGQ